MLVRCPSCKTTYKVADELVRGTTPAFRCSRCRHTFEIEPHRTVEQPVAKPPVSEMLNAPTKKEEELTFTFPSQGAREAGSPEAEIDEKDPASSYVGNQSFPGPLDQGADSWSISPDEPKSEAPVIGDKAPDSQRRDIRDSRSHSRAGSQLHQATTAPQAAADNVLALDPHRDQPASVVPYLTLFVLLIVSFGLLTAFHHVHPTTSEGVVKRIPLLGASVLKNNHLKTGVELQSLHAGYQTIQGNREVFVITGAALNLNPIGIRDVRVAARLFNHEGVEIDQQTIWIGNAISPKIIRGMTTQDISDLQRLKPLKTFDIPPGDSVSFTIVFLKTPKGVTDFGCEILSAEAQS